MSLSAGEGSVSKDKAFHPEAWTWVHESFW